MSIDSTFVVIRERTILEILDLALVVLRRRPWTIISTALAGILPFELLNQAILWQVDAIDRSFVHLLLLIMESPIATAPLTLVLGGLMFGSTPSARRVLATILTRLGPLLLYHVVFRFILLACPILVWLIPARLVFLNEVVLLERQKLSAVSSRCWTLTRDRGFELLGIWAVQFFFGGLFFVAFWIATSQLSALVGGETTWVDPSWEIILDAKAFIAIWIAVAFFGVSRFLCYLNQRIRLEGWEVALRLKSAGRALRIETESW